MGYSLLEHTADLKIKVWGKNLLELFQEAASALYSVSTDSPLPQPTQKSQKIKLEVEGKDEETLLVNFLNELLYLSDVKNQGYQVAKLELENDKLKAELLPYPLPPLKFEIKSATYHDLKIQKTKQGYEAVIVFDI